MSFFAFIGTENIQSPIANLKSEKILGGHKSKFDHNKIGISFFDLMYSKPCPVPSNGFLKKEAYKF